MLDHVNYKFPEPDIASEEARWIKIQTRLNNKDWDTEKALKLVLPKTRAPAVIFSVVLYKVLYACDHNMLTSSVLWQSEHLCLNMWVPLEGSPAGTLISSEQKKNQFFL